jgi:NADH-quinone oxidoreductase subunit G
MDTVTLTIDGKPVTVAKGTTVLRAAIESGVSVPYYCYHPGLQVDGSCRVCVVKIEKMGKLQTSCSTACTDGMVVSTRDPETVEARAGVLEFLLVNHPLDCPVCDKGGECPLQDYSYSFGPAESRMDFPRRTFDGEGVKADVDFGPTLMLNRNRCILCTRCVRFMREVEGDAQIGIIDRGAGSEIATFREEGVHSLLSGNLMDVCPVGAITTRDYRFKARPWDNPNVVDTTCTLCSKGCSTSAWLKAKPEWAKGSQLIRMTPRFNPRGQRLLDVRHRPLPVPLDRGRVAAAQADAASGRRSAAGRVARCGAEAARSHQQAGSADPESVRFLVSAHAATEELFVLKDVVEGMVGPEGLKSVAVAWARSDKPQPAGNKFPIPAVDAPNVAGARDLGFDVGDGQTPNLAGLKSAVAAGKVRVLYVVSPGPDGSLGDTSWIVEARRAGNAAGARRAGRGDERAGGRGRHRAARRGVRGKGRALHQRSGAGAGRLARHRAAGRGARRLADPGQAWGVRWGCSSATSRRPTCAARLPPRCQTVPTRPPRACRSHVRSRRGTGSGVEPVGTVEVGLHVPGPAAREGAQRPDGRPAAPDPLKPGRLIMRTAVAALVLLLLSAFPRVPSCEASKADFATEVESDARAGGRVRGLLEVSVPEGFTSSRTRRAGIRRLMPDRRLTFQTVPGVAAGGSRLPKTDGFHSRWAERTARRLRAPLAWWAGSSPWRAASGTGTDRSAAPPLSSLQQNKLCFPPVHGRRPLDCHLCRGQAH